MIHSLEESLNPWQKMYHEFTVDTVKLVFSFAIVFIQILFVNFAEISKIIRTFRVEPFMDNKMLTFVFMH